MSEQRESSELSFAHLNKPSNDQPDVEAVISTSTPLSPWRSLLGRVEQDDSNPRRHQSFDLSSSNLFQQQPIRNTLGVVPEFSLPDSSGRKSSERGTTQLVQQQHLTLRDFLRLTEIDDHASNRRSSLINTSSKTENRTSENLQKQLEYLVVDVIEEQKLKNVNSTLKQLYNKLNLITKQHEISLAQSNPPIFQQISTSEGVEFAQLKAEMQSCFQVCISQGKEQWKRGKVELEKDHFDVVSNVNNALHLQLQALEQSNQWTRKIFEVCELKREEKRTQKDQINKIKEVIKPSKPTPNLCTFQELNGLQIRLQKTQTANESLRKELSSLESKKVELEILRNEKDELRIEFQKEESQNQNKQETTKDQILYFDELLKSQMQLHFFHKLQPFQLKKIEETERSFQFEFHVGKLFRILLEYGKERYQLPSSKLLLTISMKTTTTHHHCEPSPLYSQSHFEEIKNYAKNFLEPQKRVEVVSWKMIEELWIKLNALQEFLDDLNSLYLKATPFVGFSLQQDDLNLKFCSSQKGILIYLKTKVKPFHYPNSFDFGHNLEISVPIGGEASNIKANLMTKLKSVQSGMGILERVVDNVNEAILKL